MCVRVCVSRAKQLIPFHEAQKIQLVENTNPGNWIVATATATAPSVNSSRIEFIKLT